MAETTGSAPAGKTTARPGGQSPDAMGPQALELVVKEHAFADQTMGVVHVSPGLQDRLVERSARDIGAFLADVGLGSGRDLAADIRAFYELRQDNPALTGVHGATGDGLNLWLHMLAREIQPTVMVESGVWVGRSLFSLWRAMPDAALHAFDVSFGKLLWRDESINYHEYDWSKSDVVADGNGFAYFDDHINNGRRIRESYERGFRHIVFDQCAQPGAVQPYRYPGLPSAVMIAEGVLEDGDVMEWTWRDQLISYRFESSHTCGAEDLIEVCRPLPALEPWLGSRPGHAAYVRLRHNPNPRPGN
jgi:hypothetical protein